MQQQSRREEAEEAAHPRRASFLLLGPSSHLCCASFLASSSPAPRRPPAAATTTAKASRTSFVSATTTSILPSSLFTDHESLPPLPDALSNFLSSYPDYPLSHPADRLRRLHYPHLALHLPLDYSSGFALFSPSSAAPPFALLPCASSAPSPMEVSLRSRIMSFLNLSPDDYSLVITANRAAALRLLADSYPFRSHRRLLTVYDHDSEAVTAMLDAAARRGAKPVSASFNWPGMRIQSSRLRKLLAAGDRRGQGLLLFPIQSSVTGARYSYQWLSYAQQRGWHVALDASAIGPRDMDTLGLSLFRPDFLVCNFYRVFGDDPSGFGCLVLKRAFAVAADQVPAGAVRIARSVSGSDPDGESGEITEESPPPPGTAEIECDGLDHADSLGLAMISGRQRCLVNWLVVALSKLRHPHSGEGQALVRIYGPRVKYDRGPAVAFNLFDWKGEKVEPELVQKLADRSNISVSCACLRNIWFDEGAAEERKAVAGEGRKDGGIAVVTVSLGFLASFDDVYRLWVFVARFLDADFVEKERWRCVAIS